MAIKNAIIGTITEKKTRKPYTKKSDLSEKRIVKSIENPAFDFFDGEDNEGKNIDILISGKKLLWRKIYQVYQVGIKKRFNPDSDLYFKDYVSPKFYVYNNKSKQTIFEEDGNLGMGFLKLIKFMNNL